MHKGAPLSAGPVQPHGVQVVIPAVPDGNLLLRPAVGHCQDVAFGLLVVAAVAERCPCNCRALVRVRVAQPDLQNSSLQQSQMATFFSGQL